MKLPEVKETVEEHGIFVGETVYGRRCPATVQLWTYFLQNFLSKGRRIMWSYQTRKRRLCSSRKCSHERELDQWFQVEYLWKKPWDSIKVISNSLYDNQKKIKWLDEWFMVQRFTTSNQKSRKLFMCRARNLNIGKWCMIFYRRKSQNSSTLSQSRKR